MKTRRKSDERFESYKKKIYQFLQNLKKEMAKQGVKQRELATVLEMDETVMSQRFNSRATAWKLAEIFIACDHLHINPAMLFPGGTIYSLGAMTMLELFNTLMSQKMEQYEAVFEKLKGLFEKMDVLAPKD